MIATHQNGSPELALFVELTTTKLRCFGFRPCGSKTVAWMMRPCSNLGGTLRLHLPKTDLLPALHTKSEGGCTWHPTRPVPVRTGLPASSSHRSIFRRALDMAEALPAGLQSRTSYRCSETRLGHGSFVTPPRRRQMVIRPGAISLRAASALQGSSERILWSKRCA